MNNEYREIQEEQKRIAEAEKETFQELNGFSDEENERIEAEYKNNLKELDELESNHKSQVSNGRHYFWNEEDDEKANYWQGEADKTKEAIIEYKKKHQINRPNWWDL